MRLIKDGSGTILVKGRPGSGKTCVLLDLVERIEADTTRGRLFIKSDRFCDVANEKDLTERGLPEDIPGQCARLADDRPVVVIIDALDVLSINRHHKALRVFLGLIEQLSVLKNVTTVAACRMFDLDYDPLLRSHKWDESIEVTPLDFDEHVGPFLEKWNVDPASIGVEMHDVLCIPQNLSLFAKIAKRGSTRGIGSAYQLQERFLQEIVVKDDFLGDNALDALQDMAAILIENRSHEISRARFEAEETVVQRLISQEVLSKPSENSLAFAHQTLGDNLAVRSAIAQGRTLRQFIQSHLPLPFIRPAVRSFFFYLRANEPGQFRRQVSEVTTDDEIAYHLRRLVVESLSEIKLTAGDWSLIRRLFQHKPDLFQRLFNRLRGDTWFDMLVEQWLPLVLGSNERGTWCRKFVGRLHVWTDSHTEGVFSLWHRAFDEEWDDPKSSAVSIVRSLSQVDFLPDTSKCENLLGRIVDVLPSESHHFEYTLGRLIARWVEQTNRGDDILWNYVTKDIGREDPESTVYVTSSALFLDFHRDDFFEDRLCSSSDLLSTVVKAIEDWSRKEDQQDSEQVLRRRYLRSTSWEDVRSDQESHHLSDLDRLFRALEKALKQYAGLNDGWWRSNEPRLRSSPDAALRYLTIQAYHQNVVENIDGIAAQITDPSLLRYFDLSYELGCLMHVAYPELSEATRRKNQEAILSLRDEFEDEGKLEPYRAKVI